MTRLVALCALVVGLAASLYPSSVVARSPGAGAPPRQPVSPSLELHRISLYSPALGSQAYIMVNLPHGYTSGRRRCPVLYLLAGRLAGDRQAPAPAPTP